MAADRRRLTKAEREARRERVRRRAAERAAAAETVSDRVVTLQAHGHWLRMHDFPGKICACWRAGKPYERPLLEHIRAQGFTGTAVDAGANIGNHTLWLAAVCDLQVAAFEPLLHHQLAANVTLNGLAGRVQVEPVALGAATTGAAHVGRGRLIPGSGTLPVRRLDDYRLTGVSVIKIDVEGMEPAVLRGGEQTIRRDRPVIFAEQWGDTEYRAIAAVLEPWGYRQTLRLSGKESATPVGRWDPQ